MKKIAVAEDDLTLREGLLSLLAGSGYEVYAVKNFQNAAAEIQKSGADLVLLDILLPGANGQEILRALRKESQIPVVMLTSKTGETDEILAMSSGADDYIQKPYHPTLLLLKLEAIFRRLEPKDSQSVEYKGMVLDLLRSTITCEGRETVLSKNEFSILYYLLKHQGRIVSRDELMDYLWDTNKFIDDNTLTVNVNRLRNRLQEAGFSGVIQTRRKQGYILI